MAFFDLNIPLREEPNDKTRAKAVKNTRVKLVVKAMELGYSGISYNRFISGVIADSHRNTITPLPLSNLLEASPALAETVKFHREILGVPVGDKFRQYSRITVAVDSMVQAAALNPNNPVLRTYDLVAVHPTNPKIFEHACLHLEVDLISIDFSRQLPFRLKNSLIKAALKRGVFFEVTYSRAISDLHARRNIFKQVKVLVEWTHGRNIIISSGAHSVNELRGPNDVVNMSTLFDLSMEHAKAAMSKNCRSLILHGLTRKNCYKSALEVKHHSPDGIVGSDKAWFNVSEIWDPISSGEGDVVLKANLGANEQSNDEKAPPSRAKKRRRQSSKSVSKSSSHSNDVLPHQNRDMGVNTGTSSFGLKLKESNLALDTKFTTNPNMNITVFDVDPCMKQQNSRIEKISVAEAKTHGNKKFSLSSAMEFLPLVDNTCMKEQNSRIEKISVPQAGTDDSNSRFSSPMEFLPLDANVCIKEQKSRKAKISAPQATTDGSANLMFTSSMECLPLEDITCMKEQNSRIEKISIPQAIPYGNNSSFSSSMEFQPLDDNICMREQKSRIEKISAPQATTDFNTNSSFTSTMELPPRVENTRMKEQNSRIKKVSVPQAVTEGNSIPSFSSSMEFLPLDGSTCKKEQKSRLEKTNAPQATTDGNANSSFSSPVEFWPLDVNTDQPVANGTRGTLLQTDGTLVDGVTQVSEIEIDVFKLKANEKHDTEQNMPKGILFSYDAVSKDPMPTRGVEKQSAACANGDGQMESNLETGREGKIQRGKPDSHVGLSLRGILKSGLFKKKAQSRKGIHSKTNTRKKR